MEDTTERIATESGAERVPGPGVARRKRRLRTGLMLACIGLAFALILAEIGFRALAWMADEQRVEQWTAVREQRLRLDPGMDANTGHVIRPSEYHDVIYQLLPDLNVSYKGARLITNSLGFRGPEMEPEKAEGVFRILCLGDSVMFGSGVANGEEFVRIFEKRLNEAGLSRRVEIVNTSVPGYNTGMQVSLLEILGLSYDPDMLWIDFVANDLDLPNFIGQRLKVLAIDRSFLWEWASHLLATSPKKDPLEPLAGAPTREGGFEGDPERVPAEYRHLVGIDGYRNAMRRLAERARERGLPVMVTAHHDIRPYVQEICEELGVPLVWGYPVVQRWMQANGVTTYRGSVLTISETDPHPSPFQHSLLGEFYAETILKSGYLK